MLLINPLHIYKNISTKVVNALLDYSYSILLPWSRLIHILFTETTAQQSERKDEIMRTGTGSLDMRTGTGSLDMSTGMGSLDMRTGTGSLDMRTGTGSLDMRTGMGLLDMSTGTGSLDMSTGTG